MVKKPPRVAGSHHLRVIAGLWRGRKIPLPLMQANVRPTPNRVKETLFNWLRPLLHNARCLDCFAGSGNLGFEALSQGAAQVVCMDRSAEVCAHLRQTGARFATEGLAVCQWQFPDPIPRQYAHGYDIIFFDPPQQQIAIDACLAWLLANPGLVDQQTQIYFEVNKNSPPIESDAFKVIKQKTYGQVTFGLLKQSQQYE